MEEEFYGIIKYGDSVMYDFHATDMTSAIVKIIMLISDEFPYAIGEVKDLISGAVVYHCSQRAIC
jgi:hypothetical protein